MDATSRRMQTAAMVLLGLGIAFYVAFAIGETAGGEPGGIGHLAPAVVLAALMWVAWKRPLPAGIALFVLAVPLGVVYAVFAISSVGAMGIVWCLQIVLPAWVTGALLVASGRRLGASRAPAGRPQQQV